jgi:glycerate dehydrogenase
MNIVILDAKTLGADLDLSPLNAFGEVTAYQTTSSEETASRIEDADIVITNKVLIRSNEMDVAKQLKLICIAATGMNNVDLDYAEHKDIAVKNVAGYSTRSVVQHTFAMALYLIEKIAYYDTVVKSKTWSRSGLFTDVSRPYSEIAGKNGGSSDSEALDEKSQQWLQLLVQKWSIIPPQETYVKKIMHMKTWSLS